MPPLKDFIVSEFPGQWELGHDMRRVTGMYLASYHLGRDYLPDSSVTGLVAANPPDRMRRDEPISVVGIARGRPVWSIPVDRKRLNVANPGHISPSKQRRSKQWVHCFWRTVSTEVSRAAKKAAPIPLLDPGSVISDWYPEGLRRRRPWAALARHTVDDLLLCVPLRNLARNDNVLNSCGHDPSQSAFRGSDLLDATSGNNLSPGEKRGLVEGKPGLVLFRYLTLLPRACWDEQGTVISGEASAGVRRDFLTWVRSIERTIGSPCARTLPVGKRCDTCDGRTDELIQVGIDLMLDLYNESHRWQESIQLLREDAPGQDIERFFKVQGRVHAELLQRAEHRLGFSLRKRPDLKKFLYEGFQRGQQRCGPREKRP